MEVKSSLTKFLAGQIQEIVGYGPLHALAWSAKTQEDHWIQLSVHGGSQHYLMVQFVLPEHLSRQQFDSTFHQISWQNWQADRNICLVYYLARSASAERLMDQIPPIAAQCAEAMRLLWNVTQEEQVGLLAACGPRLPYNRGYLPQPLSPEMLPVGA